MSQLQVSVELLHLPSGSYADQNSHGAGHSWQPMFVDPPQWGRPSEPRSAVEPCLPDSLSSSGRKHGSTGTDGVGASASCSQAVPVDFREVSLMAAVLAAETDAQSGGGSASSAAAAALLARRPAARQGTR